MEFLLDTHTFLWYLLGDPNLGSKAKKAILYGFKLKLNLISCRTSLQNFNASRAVSLSAEAPG